LAAVTVLTWPLAIVRPLLAFAFHGSGHLAEESAKALVPAVGVGAAAVVLALCALGRRDGRSFLLAGGLCGFLIGGSSFATLELLRSSCEDLLCKAKLFAAVLAGGGFWAAPIAVPVGVLVGVAVLALGKFVGVVQPPWLAERPGPRALAVVALLGAQLLYGLCLGYFLA
jgi:hypothetical protein